MGAPNVTYSVTRRKISDEVGHDVSVVTFEVDGEYTLMECRATKVSEDWGIGKGVLIASFPHGNTATLAEPFAGDEWGAGGNTVATKGINNKKTFEINDEDLINGDGEYRVSLFVQGTDGSWNDTIDFSLSGSKYITSDGKTFLCRKGDVIG